MIPSDRVFCDTGFFYASLARSDRHYHRAGELLEYCRNERIQMFSTWEVVSETVTLLTYRLHPQVATDFLDVIKPALSLVQVTAAVFAEAEEVFRRHVRSRRLSLCDAISFVVVTTLLENIPCLSFDEDFRALGLTVVA
ncbi:MAG: type II toxin-antitoxin system VapC family toxin [Candidatus Methylomirabilis oxyfera]|nr:type II toxin-antitoxin system VapC family toxin [Candidatus Methylomirabilis oxyfera]